MQALQFSGNVGFNRTIINYLIQLLVVALNTGLQHKHEPGDLTSTSHLQALILSTAGVYRTVTQALLLLVVTIPGSNYFIYLLM